MALELSIPGASSSDQFGKGILAYNMTALKQHWVVILERDLLGDRANEDIMELELFAKLHFTGKLIMIRVKNLTFFAFHDLHNL
jgi:hypothetical protein